MFRRALIGFMLLAGCVVVAAPAAAAPVCASPAQSGQVIRAVPWHQAWLAPDRVWPFSTGSGVTVAVIDSGVDGSHPQLRQRVLPGFDMLTNTSGGDGDCVSHGTAVASLIAAQRQENVGFVGLAPGVRILPVRITEQAIGDDGRPQGATVSPAQFAQSIRYAVDSGARVLNFSVVLYADDPAVRAAVAYALDHDVVLVAAVGNAHRSDGQRDPVPYPAAYDGVLGVGAVDAQGARDAKSQVGPYVDLVAPGTDVVAATRLSGHQAWTGTSFATPLVAAAAALVRSAEPTLPAREVVRRLLATADPARGGLASDEYGAGVINPYRAVTERPVSAAPVPPVGPGDQPVDAAAVARAGHWRQLRVVAAIAGGTVLLLAFAVLVGSYVLPRARRRRWRPGRSTVDPAPETATDRADAEDVFYST